MPVSHRSDPELHPDSYIAVLINRVGGLQGTCIAQVFQFSYQGGRKAHATNVNKCQHADIGVIDRVAAEIGEIDKAGGAGIHYSGNAMIQADIRVDPKGAAFKPMAVQVDQSRTNILSGDIDTARASLQTWPNRCNCSSCNTDIHHSVSAGAGIDNMSSLQKKVKGRSRHSFYDKVRCYVGPSENPFPLTDPDRRSIWDMLVLEDSLDFLRGDFSRCRARFLEPVFYAIDAGGSANPEDWKLSFPSLDAYAQRWIEYSTATIAEIDNIAEAERALLELTTLTEIDISGPTALARKNFSGFIPLKGGRRSYLHWQTLYFLKRLDDAWRITGFLGYLPYLGTFRLGD